MDITVPVLGLVTGPSSGGNRHRTNTRLGPLPLRGAPIIG